MGDMNMLILHRHLGESIWINNDIQIILLGHYKEVTRIGIKAPKGIKIIPDEVKQKENTKDCKNG